MTFTPLTNKDEQKVQEKTELISVAEKILKEVLGEIAEKTEPLFLKNRTLTIACINTEIATELRLHMEEIIAKINEKLGKNEVDRIRYLL